MSLTPETIAAYTGAFVAVLTAVGLAADHLWTRKLIKGREDFYNLVDAPVRIVLDAITEFQSDISDWEAERNGFTDDDIYSRGIRLSRKTNSTLNDASSSDVGGGVDWFNHASTEGFDEALANVGKSAKGLNATTLIRELDRLVSALRKLKVEKRP